LGFLIINGAYLLSGRKQQTIQKTAKSKSAFKNDIAPGSTKAILQADNNKIVLNNKDTSFILAGNTVHTNNGDVKIINKRFALYTLATPRGGEYSLILPGGTKVWLNAD